MNILVKSISCKRGLGILIFLVFLFGFFRLHGQQAANQFRRLDIHNGLSNNQINTVFSDSQGYMWFATKSGLNRFDGSSFRVFKNNPDDPGSLPENSIHRIYEDHQEKLWLFSASGQFYIYNPLNESFSNSHYLLDQEMSFSRELISSVKVDNNSNLWISSFQNGLLKYDTKAEKTYLLKHNPENPNSLSSDQIMEMALCSRGMLYIIHQSGMIDIINPDTHQVIKKMRYRRNPLVTDQNRDYKIFIDTDGDMWIYSINSGDGVYMVNAQSGETMNITHQTYPARLSNPNITGIIMDNKGNIWIGTDHGGINIVDKSDFSIRVLSELPGDNTSLSNNSITSLCKSSDGIIWVGTFKNGINYYHENLFQFSLYRSFPTQKEQLFSNDVNCFAEDSKGNLWIGTNGDGLIYYNRQNNTFSNFRNIPNNTKSLSSDVIVSLFVDHDDKLWIGTYLGGLNLYDGKTFKAYRFDSESPTSISDDRIWQVRRDRSGRLWVGTLGGGLCLYDNKSDGFIHHRVGDYNSVSSDFIITMFEDSSGNLWIGTTNGLNLIDKTTGRFHHFVNDPDNPASISNNQILSILEDVNGNIWVGTRNGLNLFKPQDETFRVFRETDGLPDHNIISIQQDNQGYLWVATLNGISRIGHNGIYQDFVFHNYDEKDGLQGREFNEHSSFRTSRGELIFGGANGFNMFFPEDIITWDWHHPVVFTDFRLFNKNVHIGESMNGRVILPVAINYAPEIILRYNQNVFTIGFSSLNFFNPEKSRFRYMLEGFNTEWLETDMTGNNATFTNLNPGKYTFRVAALGSDGEWGNETSLSITVIPPFYATPWAYAFYYLILAALVILLIVYIKKRERVKFARQQEKDEYYRIRDLDAMKTRFFTNVSHEFRTPLTMILTPLEKLLKEVKDETLTTQLLMIQRNGKRLLSLVNQLLDFRKLEVNKVSMNSHYGDIIQVLKDSFVSFVDLFDSKNIRYDFVSGIDQYYANFDLDKIEKIIFNLVSNAVKFTPENGIIELQIKRCHPDQELFNDVFSGKEYLEIQVTDTGIGIAHERHQKIFERFFQSDDNTSVINQGSGIGLSLTQEFVKMHQGHIFVKSEPGMGSCFTVQLPLETNVPMLKEQAGSIILRDIITGQSVLEGESVIGVKRPVILIVEDNEDLRFYLKENLRYSFTVIEASNGAVGWEMILSHMPQLVVSDIMMPVESGLDLCRRIKGDQRTSHIPVILLTARASGDQKLEGLQAGAEDYITKPFNYELLQLKIRRLLDLRTAFQKTFSRKFEINPGEIGITSLDEKFLEKALKIAEENIGNSDFSVEKMGRELGVSRGHLYNKLVALTGKTPIEFIRIMRLKRAAQLLGKSQLTVSEIAFQVGFNDPKYFTRYFKEEYGMVPSEYARKNK